MKEIDELAEFLEKAHGTMTITVDGMVPHVTARNLNKQGSLMCCFGALHALAAVEGADFDKTVDDLKELNKIMKYQVVGSLPSGNVVEKES